MIKNSDRSQQQLHSVGHSRQIRYDDRDSRLAIRVEITKEPLELCEKAHCHADIS